MQTSYSLYQAGAFEGMPADNGSRDVASKVSAEVVAFGRVVSRGTGDDVVKLPAASGDVTSGAIGISLHTHKEVAQYDAKETISVLKKGRVWMVVEEAVDDGDPVYVRYAGTGNKGAVRKSTVTDEVALLSNAKFITSASIGGLAVVEVNMIG